MKLEELVRRWVSHVLRLWAVGPIRRRGVSHVLRRVVWDSPFNRGKPVGIGTLCGYEKEGSGIPEQHRPLTDPERVTCKFCQEALPHLLSEGGVFHDWERDEVLSSTKYELTPKAKARFEEMVRSAKESMRKASQDSSPIQDGYA